MGEELIPLGVSQFGQTIQNIQKAKPDWLMSLLVGNSQSSFYEQAPAAGLKIPMGSSITIGLAFEHKRFKPPAMENMHVAMNWFEELNSPEAQAFKARWRAKFPDETYINDMGQNAYAAVYLYKKLVEMAGSTELAPIREQIATGQACIDGSRGPDLRRSQVAACEPPHVADLGRRRAQGDGRALLGPDRALLAGRDRRWRASSRTGRSSGWRSRWRSGSGPASCSSTSPRPGCRPRKPGRPARWCRS